MSHFPEAAELVPLPTPDEVRAAIESTTKRLALLRRLLRLSKDEEALRSRPSRRPVEQGARHAS